MYNQRLNRFIVVKGLAVALMALLWLGQAVWAEQPEVEVYIDGQALQFEQKPIIQEGTTLVPFRILFEALGFTVAWNDAERQAFGAKEGLLIALKIDSATASVNGAETPLAVPAQIVNGNTMIPLRFVSENSGYAVSYTNEAGVMTIDIRSEAGTDGAAGAGDQNDKPEPYVVKGRVVNADGKPLAGALVTADNQLLYNSNAQARTDADGRYRIPLGMVAATYAVTAEFTTEYNGSTYSVELIPDDDSPFAGNEGAIRNFTFSLDRLDSSNGSGGSGYVLFYMMDLIHPLDPTAVPPDREDVTLTLTPVGKQFDGTSGGKPIVGKGTNSPNGFGLHNVPIGRYEVTATYAPQGEAPQQLLVRTVSRGKENAFTESVVAEFSSVTEKIHRMELELKLNVTKPPEEPWVWDWEYEEPEEWRWE